MDRAPPPVKEATAAGLAVSSCADLWANVLAIDPDGYKDKISDVALKGRGRDVPLVAIRGASGWSAASG